MESNLLKSTNKILVTNLREMHNPFLICLLVIVKSPHGNGKDKIPLTQYSLRVTEPARVHLITCSSHSPGPVFSKGSVRYQGQEG